MTGPNQKGGSSITVFIQRFIVKAHFSIIEISKTKCLKQTNFKPIEAFDIISGVLFLEKTHAHVQGIKSR